MTRQGYLLLHEKRARPRVLFFALEDGFLRYYASAAPDAPRLGEFRLSGCKLAVKAHKRADGVPHSFFLETRKVFVKDRSYTLGSPVRVELSASSNDDRQEWGKALFSWQRYYWRDPSAEPSATISAITDAAAKAHLEALVDKFFARESGSGGASSYALSFAAAKQPLSFLRRNAYSLRRSMSFSTASAASTPSTASSSSSTSSARNQHQHPAAGDNNRMARGRVDCEQNKLELRKAASHVTIVPHHRGNNQEEFH